MIVQFTLSWQLCKECTRSRRKPHTKNMKERHVLGWGRGDDGSFCSSRPSTLSQGSVPHLRRKAVETERPCLGTRPEPCIILLSSPEWHVSPVLQKAERGGEEGQKQKINQRNQASLVTKNGMDPAMVWCHPDPYTASCGHHGPFKDVWEKMLKSEHTPSSELTTTETHTLLTVLAALGGSNLNR